MTKNKFIYFINIISSGLSFALLTISTLITPTLFENLSRKIAGIVAGKIFYKINIIGLIILICILLASKLIKHKYILKLQYISLLSIGLIIVSFILNYYIQLTKNNSTLNTLFGILHGASSLVYLILMLCCFVISYYSFKLHKNAI